MARAKIAAKYVHVETAGTLRDRAASIRWVATTDRSRQEAAELLRLAEELEEQAFIVEKKQDKGQATA